MERFTPNVDFLNSDLANHYSAYGMVDPYGTGYPYVSAVSGLNQGSNISCNVASCVHHTKDNHCNAGSITVGPENAKRDAETLCATYSPKQ